MVNPAPETRIDRDKEQPFINDCLFVEVVEGPPGLERVLTTALLAPPPEPSQTDERKAIVFQRLPEGSVGEVGGAGLDEQVEVIAVGERYDHVSRARHFRLRPAPEGWELFVDGGRSRSFVTLVRGTARWELPAGGRPVAVLPGDMVLFQREKDPRVRIDRLSSPWLVYDPAVGFKILGQSVQFRADSGNLRLFQYLFVQSLQRQPVPWPTLYGVYYDSSLKEERIWLLLALQKAIKEDKLRFPVGSRERARVFPARCAKARAILQGLAPELLKEIDAGEAPSDDNTMDRLPDVAWDACDRAANEVRQWIFQLRRLCEQRGAHGVLLTRRDGSSRNVRLGAPWHDVDVLVTDYSLRAY